MDSKYKTIIISIVVGEGSSGGALALSVCDSIGMLKHSIYTVCKTNKSRQKTNLKKQL